MFRWAQTEDVVGLLAKILVNAVYSREGGVVVYRGWALGCSRETRYAGQEKLPGKGLIEVKVANRRRVARGKPGLCGLGNRHECQRTQAMTDTFRGLNGVDEELIGCEKWCLREDGQVACGK